MLDDRNFEDVYWQPGSLNLFEVVNSCWQEVKVLYLQKSQCSECLQVLLVSNTVHPEAWVQLCFKHVEDQPRPTLPTLSVHHRSSREFDRHPEEFVRWWGWAVTNVYGLPPLQPFNNITSKTSLRVPVQKEKIRLQWIHAWSSEDLRTPELSLIYSISINSSKKSFSSVV